MIFNIDTHIGTYWTDPKAIRYKFHRNAFYIIIVYVKHFIEEFTASARLGLIRLAGTVCYFSQKQINSQQFSFHEQARICFWVEMPCSQSQHVLVLCIVN